MPSSDKLNQEDLNRKRGLYFSIGLHVILLLLALLPLMTYPDPPPEKEGILVNFGAPDQGQGNDQPETQKREDVNPTPPDASNPTEEVQQEQQEQSSRMKPEEKVLTEEESDVSLEKQPEKSKEQSEAEKRAKEEAIRKQQEEAARKAREKEYEESKSSFSEALKGSGKGETGTPGSQGDPSGAPDANILEGISKGEGKVGGGLSDRGVAYEPPIRDQSQKTGRVVVRVCVNAQGDVISAEYTQRGSTTTDSELRRIAREAASKFRFTEGELDRQCGTITIDFRVQ